MNKYWARVLGACITAAAFITHFVSMFNFGDCPDTGDGFLYFATVITMIGNICIIFAYYREPIIIQYKKIILIAFIIIYVVFIIPNAALGRKLDYNSQCGIDILRTSAYAITFQTGATGWFIYYYKYHCQDSSHIAGGYTSTPLRYYHQAPTGQA